MGLLRGGAVQGRQSYIRWIFFSVLKTFFYDLNLDIGMNISNMAEKEVSLVSYCNSFSVDLEFRLDFFKNLG